MTTLLERVKAYLGITTGDVDALLSSLIAAAWAFIERQTHRQLARATYTQTFDGDGGSVFFPEQYPVVAVSGISINDEPLAQATATSAGWVLVDGLVKLRGCRFSPGVGNCEVSYVAGYDPVPEDLVQAVIDMVAFNYRGKDRLGIQSQSLAGDSVSFSQMSAPASTLMTISAYARCD